MDRVEGRPDRTGDITSQHVGDPSPTTKSLLHILLRFLKLVAGESLDTGEERSPFVEDGTSE